MNTTIAVPEVQQFLAAVRARLADLDPDEQRDILDGLEADLSDLVEEQGPAALGDPDAYVRELRQAAGLAPTPGRSAGRTLQLGDRVTDLLDRSHVAADRFLAMLPADVGPLLSWLRPGWWVARAWAALQLVDLVLHAHQGWYSGELVPHLRGSGWIVLALAVIGSVQLGRGRMWPGDRRTPFARLVLVGLNVFATGVAALALQSVVDRAEHDDYARGFDSGYSEGYQSAMSGAAGPKKGLYADGTWVSQIYPYDAQGRPLVGVQLFNQIGQPINVVTQPEYSDEPADGSLEGRPRVYYPWTNGATPLLNVFPVPSRVQDSEELSPTAFAEKEPPAIGSFPLGSVPKVSLPGIKPGLLPTDR